MIQTTRMLIQPCDDSKYLRQTQGHVYSQIPGLGLSLRLRFPSDMVGRMFVSMGVAVTCHLSMVERAGFEPVCYSGCTFPVPESKYSEVK